MADCYDCDCMPYECRADFEDELTEAAAYVAAVRRWVPRLWWPAWIKGLREGFRG